MAAGRKTAAALRLASKYVKKAGGGAVDDEDEAVSNLREYLDDVKSRVPNLPGKELRAYSPSWRDRFGSWLDSMGDTGKPGYQPSLARNNFTSGVAGTTGIGDSNISISDFTPIVGSLLGAEEAIHEGGTGWQTQAMLNLFPVGRLSKRSIREDAIRGLLRKYNAAGEGRYEDAYRRIMGKASGGEVMSDADPEVPVSGRDYAMSLGRILRGVMKPHHSATSPVQAPPPIKYRDDLFDDTFRLYHGGGDWKAERLIRDPDGSTRFIEGEPGRLPDVPEGAEVVRDYPNGRPRSARHLLQGEGTGAFGHGFYGAEAMAVGEYYRNLLRARGAPNKLYELEVASSPHSFLDWDTTMYNQPHKVRESAKQVRKFSPFQTGEEWYASLARSLGENPYAMHGEKPSINASEAIKQAGIPGLKFLDLYSRRAGRGTRNYVISDESLVFPLRKFERGGVVDQDEKYASIPGDPTTGRPTRIFPVSQDAPEGPEASAGWADFDAVPASPTPPMSRPPETSADLLEWDRSPQEEERVQVAGPLEKFIKGAFKAVEPPPIKPNKIIPTFEHSTVTPEILADMSAAVEAPFNPKTGKAMQKSLNSVFPKGLAIEAIKADLQADELANLVSYLYPKGQSKFWGHHAKLSGVKPESVAPQQPLTLKEALSPENAKKQGWDLPPPNPATTAPQPMGFLGGTGIKLPPNSDLMKVAKEMAGWPKAEVDAVLGQLQPHEAELFKLAIAQVNDAGTVAKPQVFGEVKDAASFVPKNIAKDDPFAAAAAYSGNLGTTIPAPGKGWVKVGDALGSNPGGIYRNPKGEEFYIKDAYSPDHAKNDLIASALYGAAGVQTVKMHPVAGGNHIASRMEDLQIPKGKTVITNLSKSTKTRLKSDFVTHAWLANRDFPGDGGNFGFTKAGEPKVIDLGASLKYRAMGELKDDFGPKVIELDSMRDPKHQLPYSIFGDMTDTELVESARKVVMIPDTKIRDAVLGVGGDKALADTLIARKAYIADRYGILPPEKYKQAEMYKQKPFRESDYDFNLKHDRDEMIGEKDFSDAWSPPEEPNAPAIIKPFKTSDLGFQDWSKWSKYPFDANAADKQWLQKQTEENRKKGGYTTFTWRGVSTHGHTLNENMRWGQGNEGKLWTTPNIDLASDYSIRMDNVGRRYFKPYTPDPYLPDSLNEARRKDYEGKRKFSRLVPLWVNTRDYITFDAKGANFSGGTYEEIKDLLLQIKKETGESPPGVIINNVMDTPGLNVMIDDKGKKTSTTTILTLEHGKDTVRSPGANFDPKKFHLPDWFASTVGLIGGGGAMLSIWDPEQASAAHPIQKWRGGSVLDKALKTAKKYATGGPLKTEGLGDPSNHAPFKGGMLNSDIPGRTDRLPIRLKSGSYVIPADIPSASALGEGNTMAGNKVLDKLMEPHRMRPSRGIQPIRKRRLKMKSAFKAEGGEVGEVPIIAAGGEYVVEPEVVASIGGGDLDKGHENLDKFVRNVRRHNIKTLRKLPGPKKN